VNQKPIKAVLEKINFYALLLFAFSLNFPQEIVKYTLSFWIITSLFVVDFRQKSTIKKRYYIPMLLISILIAGRIIVSIIHGDFELLFQKLIDTQLTLLVLPLFLVFQVNSYFNLKLVLKTYILGCLLSCIIIVGYFYLYRFNIIIESIQSVFPKGVQKHNLTEDIILFQGFTTEYFKHRAAIGVNLSLSIACLIYLVKQSHGISNWKKTGSIIVGFLFILVLYASGSRSGYISLFFVLIVGLIYLFSKRKKILSIAFLCTIGLLIGLSSLKTTRPLLFNEISTCNYDEIRNMDPRFQIWESCIDIIRQNPVIGVGYSHVKPELLQKYKEKGLEINLREKFDSHNQFFQFALESGIWTSVIFAFIFLPIYFRRKTLYISMAFSVTFIVYSMFEDSFLVINGISVFVFFISTLTLSQKSKPKCID